MNAVEKKKINIGLIGIGYWGRNVLRNLYEAGVLCSACDLDAEILAIIKKDFPKVHYTLHTQDIMETADVNAVAIATPASTHYELVKQALQANKDVFVEKPLALKSGHGEELVALAKERKRILMVGHLLHYHPAVIKLQELIRTGELGKVQYIYSNRLNIGKLRIEENILWSFAPHDMSVILMLAGEEPIKVSCFGEDYLSEGVYDITMTTLDFRHGIKAHIFVSWLHPFKEQKLVVVGSRAMAVFDDLSKEKLFIYPHQIRWKNGRIPVVQKAEHYCVAIDEKEPLKEEMEHFIECVLKRKVPKTDGEEGLKVLRVLEAAERAIEKKSFSHSVSEKNIFFLHPSSYVDDHVEIGKDTKIWYFSHILKNTKIGECCIIGQNVMIGPHVTVGARCKIQNNVSIYEKVTLEEDVFCGPSCVFTNVYNPRAFIERKSEFLPTLVKRGTTIGANATVVCGVTIGKYAFIGAGAVVNKDIPDYALFAGVPARQIGWVCKCGITLKFSSKKAKCKYCGLEYRLKGKIIQPLK